MHQQNLAGRDGFCIECEKALLRQKALCERGWQKAVPASDLNLGPATNTSRKEASSVTDKSSTSVSGETASTTSACSARSIWIVSCVELPCT